MAKKDVRLCVWLWKDGPSTRGATQDKARQGKAGIRWGVGDAEKSSIALNNMSRDLRAPDTIQKPPWRRSKHHYINHSKTPNGPESKRLGEHIQHKQRLPTNAVSAQGRLWSGLMPRRAGEAHACEDMWRRRHNCAWARARTTRINMCRPQYIIIP